MFQKHQSESMNPLCGILKQLFPLSTKKKEYIEGGKSSKVSKSVYNGVSNLCKYV